MEDSILTSTKQNVGVAQNVTVFDSEFIMHINSAFSTVHQLGVGPDDGFVIEDDSKKWSDFKLQSGEALPQPQMNLLRGLIYRMVKRAFDIPKTSFEINALEEQIKEDTHRLSEYREGSKTLDQDPKEVSPVW